VLLLQALVPLILPGPEQLRLSLFGQCQEILGVCSQSELDRSALLKLLKRVLPDRLQQPVAHGSFVASFDHDQRLLHEPGEQIQDLALRDACT